MQAFAIAAVTVGCLLPSAVWPQRAPLPTLAYTGPRQGELALATANLCANYARDRGLGFYDLADPPTDESHRDRLQLAIEKYSQLLHEEAQALLDPLAIDIESGSSVTLTHQEMGDVFFYRGMNYVELGADNKAWVDLVRAATFTPERVVDEGTFRPSLVAVYRRAHHLVTTKPKAIVTVDVDVGCEVQIDARRYAVATPASFWPGEHHISIRCVGKKTWNEMTLFEPGAQNLRPVLEAQADPRAQVLAAEKGAGRIIWVDASRIRFSRIAIALMDPRSKRNLRTWSLRIASSDDVASLPETLDSVLRSEFAWLRPEPPSPTPKESGRWLHNKWLWFGLGVVAASGAILPFATAGGESTGFAIEVKGTP